MSLRLRTCHRPAFSWICKMTNPWAFHHQARISCAIQQSFFILIVHLLPTSIPKHHKLQHYNIYKVSSRKMKKRTKSLCLSLFPFSYLSLFFFGVFFLFCWGWYCGGFNTHRKLKANLAAKPGQKNMTSKSSFSCPSHQTALNCIAHPQMMLLKTQDTYCASHLSTLWIYPAMKDQ